MTEQQQQEQRKPAAAEGAREGNERPQRERKPYRRGGRGKRRKVCYFTVNKITYIDYKDTELLKKFISERGKILPRRVTRYFGEISAHADRSDQTRSSNGSAAIYDGLRQ